MSMTMKKKLVARRRARGVTLVEVLIVVAILSLIAGGVAVFAIPQFQKAQVDTAKTDLKTLYQVIETWKLNHPGSSECPTIEVLKSDKALKPDQNTNDPWGHAYKIYCNSDDIGVQSAGKDGKDGSEDDLWSGVKPTK